MTPTTPPASRAFYTVQLGSGQELRLEQAALEPEPMSNAALNPHLKGFSFLTRTSENATSSMRLGEIKDEEKKRLTAGV